MKVHVKAALYDELIKDYQELITEMKAVKDELDAIPNRPDLLEIREKQGYGMYTAGKCGCYGAMGFGIELKLTKHEGLIRWYQNQK